MGVNTSWYDINRETLPQPPAVHLSCAAVPRVCCALPGVMPEPTVWSSDCGGPHGSAENRCNAQAFVVHSDDGPTPFDKEAQWFTLARQLGEGIAILEGDGRLR